MIQRYNMNNYNELKKQTKIKLHFEHMIKDTIKYFITIVKSKKEDEKLLLLFFYHYHLY